MIDHNYLLHDHSIDLLRSGEGAAIELADGRIFLAYGIFRGGGDHSPATLVSRRSADGGVTWDEPTVFYEPAPGDVNAMSLSFVRLGPASIGCIVLRKLDRDTCTPHWRRSDDDGETWSDPVPISGPGYHVVNNDRVVRLSSGRILVPYAWSPLVSTCSDPECGCLISDDDGATWRYGEERLRILPANYRQPALVDPENADAALAKFRDGSVLAQEPGVVELAGGEVMMWARSNGGYAYAARSQDGGETWSPFLALGDTPQPCGPQSILRLPGSKRLIMLHPDRTGVPYGTDAFNWRTPINVSVSDDEARTWQPSAPLIADDSVNYCYFSVCFYAAGTRCLVTTYSGITEPDPARKRARRNLVSMRVVTCPVSHFLGG